MPHLWIRGIAPELVKAVSRELAAELASVCECPPEDIMLECLTTSSVSNGQFVPSYPFVEVGWFDRGLPAQDRFAEAVDRYLRVGCGVPELEVAFRAYEKRNYYANGKSFGDSVPAEGAGVDEGTGVSAGAGVRAEPEKNLEANPEQSPEQNPERNSEKSMEAELERLRLSNRKLTDDLARARKALQSSAGGMSSKLYDALRE
ncbi:DUF1904 family protein [Cohnella fermenti]|uniref:DUF1904 family protein n=1 Tax=Cohnella fermenti TaxID=2565925 RepID=A0A4S4BLA2_9BACL|nr:DUF1904 family protein [Cohnella fermenti]THF74946.1 DUF1904 family protein [Cohnella fermenti]